MYISTRVERPPTRTCVQLTASRNHFLYHRVMGTRCGVFKAPAPSAADLVPGARTLYTTDGQAVTVVAAHVDPGEVCWLAMNTCARTIIAV